MSPVYAHFWAFAGKREDHHLRGRPGRLRRDRLLARQLQERVGADGRSAAGFSSGSDLKLSSLRRGVRTRTQIERVNLDSYSRRTH